MDRLLSFLTPRRLIIAAVMVAACAAAIRWHLDLSEVRRLANEMDPWVLFALLTALPLAGCPATLLHVAVGVRLGAVAGIAVVAVSIFLQLLASYGIVRALPRFFEARLATIRRRLPPASHGALTVFVLLLPGAPYSLQLYVLPLVGVPFRIFFWLSFPIHLVRSVAAIGFGIISENPLPGSLAWFSAYVLVLLLIWAWSFQRLRHRLNEDPSPKEDGPTPRG